MGDGKRYRSGKCRYRAELQSVQKGTSLLHCYVRRKSGRKGRRILPGAVREGKERTV